MSPEQRHEHDKQLLLQEIESLRRRKTGQGSAPFAKFKLIELAAARRGMYPSYAYWILESPFSPPIERKASGNVTRSRGMRAG